MSILIIGGSGFIGRELTKSLIAKGITVIVKTRDSEKTELIFDEMGCQPLIIEDYSELDSIINKPKAVISLAGAGIIDKRWSEKRKQELVNSRTLPLQELKSYLENSNTKLARLIVGSAIGYYGYPQNTDTEFTETSKIKAQAITDDEQNRKSEFTYTVCATLENTAEQLRPFCDSICVLRTGVVIGNGGALKRMSLAAKFHLNGIIGDGKQWISWIHIQDWIKVAQYILSLDTPRGIYNMCTPEPTTNEELSLAIAKAVDKNYQVPISASMLKIVLGEASILLTDSQKVIPANLEAANFNFEYTNIEKACEDLLNGH